jgi:hypothetical protein
LLGLIAATLTGGTQGTLAPRPESFVLAIVWLKSTNHRPNATHRPTRIDSIIRAYSILLSFFKTTLKPYRRKNPEARSHCVNRREIEARKRIDSKPWPCNTRRRHATQTRRGGAD